jgi:hypothetical protein
MCISSLSDERPRASESANGQGHTLLHVRSVRFAPIIKTPCQYKKKNQVPERSVVKRSPIEATHPSRQLGGSMRPEDKETGLLVGENRMHMIIGWMVKE